MNRIRTTALSISMVLIMIGMMLLPAAMGIDVDDYTVTVSSGQSTSITTTSDVAFGSLAPGTSDNAIANSFGLTNVGNTDSTVTAKFTNDNVSDIYGLTYSTTHVIGGSNFSMKATSGGAYTDLNDDGTSTAFITGSNVTADAVEDQWSVELDIPSGQAAYEYNGTVELTFANV